jgi:hypothetical protein
MGGTVDRDMGAYPFGDTTIVGLIPAGAPTVIITSPQGSGTYITTNSTVGLAGTALDNLAVTSVTWNCSTDGSGTASGTASWSVASIPLQPGNNVVTITAHDADGNTGSAVLTVEYRPVSSNQPPVANAGTDQSVSAGASVLLDGRLSYDPDAWPAATLTYAWTRVSGPAITIFGAGSARPSFIATAAGTNVLQLTVYDGAIYSTDQVTVVVVPVGANLPPAANAGTDVIGAVGVAVTLDGSASDDPDDAPSALTYSWTQEGGPTVALAGASTAAPSFLPAAEGTYVFRLTVSDGAAQASDTVAVTVLPVGSNLPPTAYAGPDQSVSVGDNVRLDASGSSDPDGDAVVFAWTQVSGPVVTIDHADDAVAFVAVAQAGTYVFRVTVSDAEYTDDDTVVITVTEADDVVPGTAPRELQLRPNRLVLVEGTIVQIVGPAAIGDGKAVVYSVSGKVVTDTEIAAVGNAVEGMLDAALLEPGIYLVAAGSGANVHRARLVVE